MRLFLKKQEVLEILIGCIILFVVLVIGLVVFYNPKSRTVYLSYESFWKDIKTTEFVSELPESAQDIRYYRRKGMYSYRAGCRFVLSQEDYNVMKQERIKYFEDYIKEHSLNSDLEEATDEWYLYDGQNKMAVDIDDLKDKKIDFLSELFIAETSDYYFLNYICRSGVSIDLGEHWGIICNDATCEVIWFSYRYVY